MGLGSRSGLGRWMHPGLVNEDLGEVQAAIVDSQSGW